MPRVDAGSGLRYCSCAADRLPLATAVTELHEDALLVRICKAASIQGSDSCESSVWHAPIQVEIIAIGDKQALHAAWCGPLYKANCMRHETADLASPPPECQPGRPMSTNLSILDNPLLLSLFGQCTP